MNKPVTLAAALAAGLFATAAQALTAAQCAALTGLSVPATTITGASLVPAGAGLPEYCNVSGRVDTEINFELRLPSAWNGKFYHQGGGGFVGSIPAAGPGLVRGYAAVATDTGHIGQGVAALDGSWALNNPMRQINFGHRAVHVVTVAAKQIVAAAYGRAASRSYFEGCSNGGRQAMMEAQRYPADFDGIIAGAPALDWTGLMTGFNYNQQAIRATPIPPEKLTVLARGVVAQCDAKDGLVDGLVDNPRRCGFDPGVLQCASGDGPNCLTAAQVATARKIYDGPVNSRGEQLHPGFPPGAEDGFTGWQLWISGPSGFPAPVNNNPFQFTFSDHYLRFMVFSDPAYDSMTFDFDDDTARVNATAPIFGATDADLRPFRARGGKLLMWHGWSDHALMADRSIEYYNAVIQAMGNKNKVDDFFRLFLAPGMHHCAGGPGPNSFDALTALEAWVEQGRAPNSLVATNDGSTGVKRSRPLCSYPKVAVYTGKGDPNAASSFSCEERGLGYSLGGVPTGQ